MNRHATKLLFLIIAVLFVYTAGPAIGKDTASLSDKKIKSAIDDAYSKYKDLQEGANADYIPALAKVDSNIYGIVLAGKSPYIVETGAYENIGCGTNSRVF